jgi:hypothetical protein
MQIRPTESATRCRHLGVPKNDRHPASNFQAQARGIWAVSVCLTASDPASDSRFKFLLRLRSYIVRAFGRCRRCCEESSDASWSAGGRTSRRPSSMRIRPPQGDRWRVASGRSAFARGLWGTAIRTRCSTGFFFSGARRPITHGHEPCAGLTRFHAEPCGLRRVTHWSFGLCRLPRYRRAIGVQNCINIQYSIHLSGAAASRYFGYTRCTNLAARARMAANGRPSCPGQLIQTDRQIVI